MTEKGMKTPRATALERGLAKLQTQRQLYAGLTPEAGGHRPLTIEERKVQKAAALTVEERTAVQEHEYGQFVAVTHITHEGRLAYGPGHRVPASSVEQFGYEADGLVARVEAG